MVGILALIAIGGGIAAVQFLQPRDTGDLVADDTTVDAGPAPAPAQPDPVTDPPITVTIPGTELEIPAGVSCVTGERFEFAATGTVWLDSADPTSNVGPYGWHGEDRGYLSYYGFEPGRLAAGLYGWDAQTYAAFDEGGRAAYTCPADGELWLMIDDLVSSDNTGGFDVQIQRLPM